MNANLPKKPKYVFMLVNQHYGHPNPWALISEEQEHWPPESYMPMASFKSKEEALTCLRYCVAMAEMGDAEKPKRAPLSDDEAFAERLLRKAEGNVDEAIRISRNACPATIHAAMAEMIRAAAQGAS